MVPAHLWNGVSSKELTVPDLTVPPTGVLVVSGSLGRYNAGVATVAGKSVVLDVTDLWQHADASVVNGNYGITVNEAAIGQPVDVILAGILNLGVALQEGQLYVISQNSGMIAPITDLVATDFYSILGYANDNNQLVMRRYPVPFALT